MTRRAFPCGRDSQIKLKFGRGEYLALTGLMLASYGLVLLGGVELEWSVVELR